MTESTFTLSSAEPITIPKNDSPARFVLQARPSADDTSPAPHPALRGQPSCLQSFISHCRTGPEHGPQHICDTFPTPFRHISFLSHLLPNLHTINYKQPIKDQTAQPKISQQHVSEIRCGPNSDAAIGLAHPNRQSHAKSFFTSSSRRGRRAAISQSRPPRLARFETVEKTTRIGTWCHYQGDQSERCVGRQRD